MFFLGEPLAILQKKYLQFVISRSAPVHTIEKKLFTSDAVARARAGDERKQRKDQ
jgi:hypothetical protein